MIRVSLLNKATAAIHFVDPINALAFGDRGAAQVTLLGRGAMGAVWKVSAESGWRAAKLEGVRDHVFVLRGDFSGEGRG